MQTHIEVLFTITGKVEENVDKVIGVMAIVMVIGSMVHNLLK